MFHLNLIFFVELRMADQVVKRKKLMSEYEKQLYDKVHSNILAAIQGKITKV